MTDCKQTASVDVPTDTPNQKKPKPIKRLLVSASPKINHQQALDFVSHFSNLLASSAESRSELRAQLLAGGTAYLVYGSDFVTTLAELAHLEDKLRKIS